MLLFFDHPPLGNFSQFFFYKSAVQAVDDGVLQPLLGDLVWETNDEDPSVFGIIGSNHGNRLHVGYQDQNMKIRLQGEKKKQES